ncbi:MAG: hypothetical protein ACYSUQ_06550 [Planctomycetota bacterium]|jgi:hypothetical protein
MNRCVAIILCLLVFHVVPALCVSGVLAHPCGCEETAGCDAECEPNPGTCQCQHEADCGDDPCGTVLTKPKSDENDAAALVQPSVAPADLPDDDHRRCTSTGPQVRWESLPRDALPYHPSDLPLLL